MSDPKASQKSGFRPKQPRSIRARTNISIDPSEYTSSYKPAEQQDHVHAISKARDEGVKALDDTIKRLLSQHDPYQTYRRVLITRWEEEEVWGSMGTGDISSEDYQKRVKYQVDLLNNWGDNWNEDLYGDNKQTGRDAFYKTFTKLMKIKTSDPPEDAPTTEAHSTEPILPMPMFTGPDIDDRQFATNGTSEPEDNEGTTEPAIYQVEDAVFVTGTPIHAQHESEYEYGDELLELAGYTEAYEEGASKDTYQESDEQHDHRGYTSSAAMSDTAEMSEDLLENVTDTMISPTSPPLSEQGNTEHIMVDSDYPINEQTAPHWDFGGPSPASGQSNRTSEDETAEHSYQENANKTNAIPSSATWTSEISKVGAGHWPGVFTYSADTAGVTMQPQKLPEQPSPLVFPPWAPHIPPSTENAEHMDWEEQRSVIISSHIPHADNASQDALMPALPASEAITSDVEMGDEDAYCKMPEEVAEDKDARVWEDPIPCEVHDQCINRLLSTMTELFHHACSQELRCSVDDLTFAAEELELEVYTKHFKSQKSIQDYRDIIDNTCSDLKTANVETFSGINSSDDLERHVRRRLYNKVAELLNARTLRLDNDKKLREASLNSIKRNLEIVLDRLPSDSELNRMSICAVAKAWEDRLWEEGSGYASKLYNQACEHDELDFEEFIGELDADSYEPGFQCCFEDHIYEHYGPDISWLLKDSDECLDSEYGNEVVSDAEDAYLCRDDDIQMHNDGGCAPTPDNLHPPGLSQDILEDHGRTLETSASPHLAEPQCHDTLSSKYQQQDATQGPANLGQHSQASWAPENVFKLKAFSDAAANYTRSPLFPSLRTAQAPAPVPAIQNFTWPPADTPSAGFQEHGSKSMFDYVSKPADTASKPTANKDSTLFGDFTSISDVLRNLEPSKPTVKPTFSFGGANPAKATISGAESVLSQQEQQSRPNASQLSTEHHTRLFDSPVMSSIEPAVRAQATLGLSVVEQSNASQTLAPQVSQMQPSSPNNVKAMEPLLTAESAPSADAVKPGDSDVSLADRSEPSLLDSAAVMQAPTPAITMRNFGPPLHGKLSTVTSRPISETIFATSTPSPTMAFPEPTPPVTSKLFDISSICFGRLLDEKSFKLTSKPVIDFVPNTTDLSGLKGQASLPQEAIQGAVENPRDTVMPQGRLLGGPVESPIENLGVMVEDKVTEDPSVILSEMPSTVNLTPERQATDYEDTAQSTGSSLPVAEEVTDTQATDVDSYASSETERSQGDVSEPPAQVHPSTASSQVTSSSTCSSVGEGGLVSKVDDAQPEDVTQTSEIRLSRRSYKDNPRYQEIMAKWNATQARVALLLDSSTPLDSSKTPPNQDVTEKSAIAHETASESGHEGEAYNQIEAVPEPVAVVKLGGNKEEISEASEPLHFPVGPPVDGLIEATHEIIIKDLVELPTDVLVDPTSSTGDKPTGVVQLLRPLRRGRGVRSLMTNAQIPFRLRLPIIEAGAVKSQDWLAQCHADSLRRQKMRIAEDEALQRQRQNPTPRPTRLCRIGKIAIRICRFINDWEAQIDKNLPEILCESVEDLIDAYRYMDRTDSGRTLKDIRQLHHQWVSMRKVIKAYKNIALSFDPLAREKIEHLHHASTLAPRGSQELAESNAKLKKKLDTMTKRFWEFLEVAQELHDRAQDLMQYGLKESIKATLIECSVILERVHMVLHIPLPGVAATTVDDDDEL